MLFRRTALAALAACLLAGPAAAQELSDEWLEFMGRKPDAEVATIAEAAAVHPLGSQENPVRASDVSGQRDYLRRLRCADGKVPKFSRTGSFGAGIYGSIIDGYLVLCPGSEPAETMVFIDLYHPGHVEAGAVPGFTITAP